MVASGALFSKSTQPTTEPNPTEIGSAEGFIFRWHGASHIYGKMFGLRCANMTAVMPWRHSDILSTSPKRPAVFKNWGIWKNNSFWWLEYLTSQDSTTSLGEMWLEQDDSIPTFSVDFPSQQLQNNFNLLALRAGRFHQLLSHQENNYLAVR